MRTLRPLGHCVALSLVLVAGCARSDDGSAGEPATSGSQGSSSPAPAGAVEVRAQPGFTWDLPAFTARAGEITVTVVNDDEVFHQMQILQGTQPVVDAVWEVYAAGDTATEVVTLAPGEYRIFCIVPGHEQMDSALTVTP